ncbi:MAG: Ig-like domain-containing protein [Halobacteria archaeon]|nr:Ig-like domain-containing protein [Halobacteria archaeon]
MKSIEEGVSPIIGFILMFGILLLLLVTLQITAVPIWNENAEFSHSQRVQEDINTLQSDVESTAARGTESITTVEMGIDYPTRPFLINPPNPAGSIKTSPAANLSLQNVEAVKTETSDYWNGDERDFVTKSVEYEPDYNQYQNAPDTVFDGSVVYNEFDSADILVSRSNIISGRRITLLALNGSLMTSEQGSINLDITPLSAPHQTVAVTNSTGGNVTLEVPTRMSEERWDDILQTELASSGGYVHSYSVDNGTLTVEMVSEKDGDGVTYNLRMAKIGIGNDYTEEDEHYITQVTEDTNVGEGTSRNMVVEVRDRYNNPVSGVEVEFGGVSEGSISPGSDATGTDGRASVRYTAPDDIDGSNLQESLNASIDVDPDDLSDFDPRSRENLTFSIDVVNTDASGLGGDGGGNATTDRINPNQETDVSLAYVEPVSQGGSKEPVEVRLRNKKDVDVEITQIRFPFYIDTQGGNHEAFDSMEMQYNGGSENITLHRLGDFKSLSPRITIPNESTTTLEFDFGISGNDKLNLEDFYMFSVRIEWQKDGEKEAINSYFIAHPKS